jgi:hypothetical protein
MKRTGYLRKRSWPVRSVLESDKGMLTETASVASCTDILTGIMRSVHKHRSKDAGCEVLDHVRNKRRAVVKEISKRREIF